MKRGQRKPGSKFEYRQKLRASQPHIFGPRPEPPKNTGRCKAKYRKAAIGKNH
jgi:hypothetical protein